MITSLKQMEWRILEHLVLREHASRLAPLTWEEVPARVWVPAWEKAVRTHASFLAGVTPPAIPTLSKDLGNAIRFFKSQVEAEIAKAQQREASEEGPVQLGLSGHGGALDALQERLEQFRALGAGLTLALLNSGWKLNASPGEMCLEWQGSRIEPFAVLAGFQSGSLDAQAWIDECMRLGINNVMLGTPTAAPDARPSASASAGL